MSEEVSKAGELLGNFPQAFSHVGLISTIFNGRPIFLHLMTPPDETDLNLQLIVLPVIMEFEQGWRSFKNARLGFFDSNSCSFLLFSCEIFLGLSLTFLQVEFISFQDFP